MKYFVFTMLLPAFIGIKFHSGNSLTGNNQNPVADTTLKGEWFLQPVLPSDTAAGINPSLTFDPATNTFSGNNGCNNIQGRFRHSGNSLMFSRKINSTKKLCPGYNETEFMNNLMMVNRYSIEQGVLTLMHNQTMLSRWSRKKPTEKTNEI